MLNPSPLGIICYRPTTIELSSFLLSHCPFLKSFIDTDPIEPPLSLKVLQPQLLL
jgi:hypothetical protein